MDKLRALLREVSIYMASFALALLFFAAVPLLLQNAAGVILFCQGILLLVLLGLGAVILWKTIRYLLRERQNQEHYL